MNGNSLSPTLAESIEPALLIDLVQDENTCFEQKLDGKRLMVIVENGQAHGVNRNRVVELDPEISFAAISLGERLTLDGEMVGRKFYVFDLPVALDLVSPDTPYSHRRAALEALAPHLTAQTNKIEVLPASTTSDEKIRLIKWVADHRTEGIMAKNLEAPYLSGLRTTNWLKAKMVKTCDVFITGLMINGKRNASMGVYDEFGEPVDVGTVTMTDARLRIAKIGDVLEVRYLYASEERKLVQPHLLRFRSDKLSPECKVDQLIFTDKTTIYRKGQ